MQQQVFLPFQTSLSLLEHPICTVPILSELSASFSRCFLFTEAYGVLGTDSNANSICHWRVCVYTPSKLQSLFCIYFYSERFSFLSFYRSGFLLEYQGLTRGL